jgi:hypothetical protein
MRMITKDQLLSKSFIALAPTYLITSGYLMQAHTERPSAVALVGSVFFMLASVWMVVAAFWKNLDDKVKRWTYEAAFSLSMLTALVFILGWLGVSTKLVELKAAAWYVNVYAVLGFGVFLAISAFYPISLLLYREKKPAGPRGHHSPEGN